MMGKIKFSKGQMTALAALFIVFACYAAEKAFKRLTEWNSVSALLQACVYVVCVVVVYFLIVKSKETYFGMISALFAFKIMPPQLIMLQYANADAYMIYYIAGKAAIVLYILAIYKLYKSQPSPKEIKAEPVLAVILVANFISPISEKLSAYVFGKTGTMMLPYAVQALCYILIMAVLIIVACMNSGKSATLVTDFSIIGLVINILRKTASLLILASAGMHISKSYFCWIAIYAVLIVCFVIVRKKRELKLN